VASGEFPEVRHLAEEEVTVALVAGDTAEAADLAAEAVAVTVEVAEVAVVVAVAEVAVVAEVTVEAVAADTGTSRFRVK